MPTTEELLAAYRATSYCVEAPGRELLLYVDRADAGVAKLLREAWVESAALLTAWNPGSTARPADVNRVMQAALVRDLEAAGCPCLRARNQPDGDSAMRAAWTEESVLALGITLAQANALASQYGQLAFLWISSSDATPRMVVTAAATNP